MTDDEKKIHQQALKRLKKDIHDEEEIEEDNK
jgi:hypothetical protein